MRKIILVLLLFALIIFPLYAGGNRWTSKPPIGSTIDWSHPLSKGLVGCWLMNEEGGRIVNDIARLNKGNLVGNTFWKTGNLIFDGTGDYVEVPNSVSLNEPTVTGQVSIVVKFKATNLAGTSFQRLVSKLISCYDLTVSEGSDKIQFFVDSASALEGNTVIAENEVYVSCATYNRLGGANNQKLYINGKKDKEVTETAGLNLNSGVLQIGNYPGLTRELIGTINYVYIYSRVLSPSEIRQLYQDPYCFIKSPTIWSMFSTAVAAARRFFIFD